MTDSIVPQKYEPKLEASRKREWLSFAFLPHPLSLCFFPFLSLWGVRAWVRGGGSPLGGAGEGVFKRGEPVWVSQSTKVRDSPISRLRAQVHEECPRKIPGVDSGGPFAAWRLSGYQSQEGRGGVGSEVTKTDPYGEWSSREQTWDNGSQVLTIRERRHRYGKEMSPVVWTQMPIKTDAEARV
jgi:nitrate reductase NapE component